MARPAEVAFQQDARIAEGGVEEVILALPATVDGATTTHYLMDRLAPLKVAVTRLAQGVPIGGALTIVWWVFVALSLGAAILALARSRVAASKAVSTPPEALPARGTPAAAEARRNRRRLHRATRPTILEVAITVALFAGAAALWLLAG